jgi:hypothetical protein
MIGSGGRLWWWCPAACAPPKRGTLADPRRPARRPPPARPDLLRDVGAHGRCNAVFTSSTDSPGDLSSGLRKAILEGQTMQR